MPFTTIRIDDETRDRLKAMGKMGESYNEVIKRLLDVASAPQKSDSGNEFSRPIRPSSFG